MLSYFSLSRLKTGLAKASINWSGLTEQLGDIDIRPFSYLTGKVDNHVGSVCIVGRPELFTSIRICHRTIRFHASERELHQELMPLSERTCTLVWETVRGAAYSSTPLYDASHLIILTSFRAEVLSLYRKQGDSIP
jgi:hypothetical protein